MDKLIRQKQTQIKEKEKEIKRLKMLSLYKKKEDKILQTLKKFKSKSKVSKKVSNKGTRSTSSLTKKLIYTGTGLVGLLLLYRIYKHFAKPENNNDNDGIIQMTDI